MKNGESQEIKNESIRKLITLCLTKSIFILFLLFLFFINSIYFHYYLLINLNYYSLYIILNIIINYLLFIF